MICRRRWRRRGVSRFRPSVLEREPIFWSAIGACAAWCCCWVAAFTKSISTAATSGPAPPPQFGGLVAQAVARGLSGLEFGEGIPGSVGGALIMNAGAFGGEMAPVVSAVRGADADGRIRTLARNEVDFLYRRSILPPGFIVSAVEFDLIPGDRENLAATVAELKAKRAARQPQGVPNAGSIFKNPPGNFAGTPAGAMRTQGRAHRRRRVFGPACELYRQSRWRAGNRSARADRAGAAPG